MRLLHPSLKWVRCPRFGSEYRFSLLRGPIVVIILEGASAVEVVRRMIGSTNSLEAPGGTVRGDLGLATTENVVHASDSIESFERESRILGLT